MNNEVYLYKKVLAFFAVLFVLTLTVCNLLQKEKYMIRNREACTTIIPMTIFYLLLIYICDKMCEKI